MRNNTLLCTLSFSIILSAVLFPAEQSSKTPAQAIVSNSWFGSWSSSGNSVSPSTVPFLPLAHSPSPSTSPFGYMASCMYEISNNMSSLKDTVMNVVSDDKALIKLGWPANDSQAQQELRKTRNAYAQVITTPHKENRAKFFALIFRRTDFLHRIYTALPNRPDRIALTQFLLEQHSPAMSPLLKQGFQFFIEDSAKEALEATGKEYAPKDTNPSHLPCFDKENNDINNTFLILGWAINPKDEEKAKKNLEKSKTVYTIKKILDASENCELSQTEDGRKKLLKDEDLITKKMISDPCYYDIFVRAREVAISKVNRSFLKGLPFLSSLEFLKHCLDHHAFIISPCQKGTIRAFIRELQLCAQKIYEEFSQTKVS